MKKALSIFFLLLSLLAFKNITYAETPIDACWNFNKAEDYKRAIEAGKLAVKKYPKNLDAYYAWEKLTIMLESLNLLIRTWKKQ